MIRYQAIWDCVSGIKKWEYFFPLIKYHSSFFTSLAGIGNKDVVEEGRGYISFDDYKDATDLIKQYDTTSEARCELYDLNLRYLEKILKLCKDNNAELILVRAPLPCDQEIIAKENSVQDWADAHGVDFINYIKKMDEINLDLSTDSLDGGFHLNKYGPERYQIILRNTLRVK